MFGIILIKEVYDKLYQRHVLTVKTKTSLLSYRLLTQADYYELRSRIEALEKQLNRTETINRDLISGLYPGKIVAVGSGRIEPVKTKKPTVKKKLQKDYVGGAPTKPVKKAVKAKK